MMFEIELKAYVKNRNATIQKINSFACFERVLEKRDEYFRLVCGAKIVTARIRTEKKLDAKNAFDFQNSKIISKKIFLTYKKKERRENENGVVIEVNDERETEISDADCVKTLLSESGFLPHFSKQKKSVGWIFECGLSKFCSSARLELCTVPPLGDFLEIEIISQIDDALLLEKIRLCLEDLVLKAGLELSDIEKRYYSELLEEASKNV